MIMLDTNHCLSIEPSPPGSPPMADDMEKAALKMDHDRLVYHSLKEVLQLKLQQRRTREELVSQGIMPPLKSPAAFHEQRRSLERARTEDYLKRKIRSRPERSELVRMHILEETSAEPSLQAKQLQLKRARLADDLNDKISHRPGPIELVHKNILSVSCPLQHSLLDSPKGAGGESSSLDEDSSDALSPDQLTNHDSPLSAVPQLSPSGVLTPNGDISPTQFLTQPPPPPPPPPPQVNGSDSSPLPKMTNGTMVTSASSRPSGQVKSQAKSSSDRPPQRPKKPKDNKPKVKKLKYHQYIPPDQKADKERPPQMDSSYAKLLHQQQLFLQLQILSQQQQHYNYHTILPAPPKPQTEQPPTTSSGPSPSRSVHMTTTAASTGQTVTVRQSQAAVGGAKPATLPANLDEFKVAELKQELKLRGLTVSGTKNDLIERLRNYQEQNGGAAVLKNGISQSSLQGTPSAASTTASSPTTTSTPEHQSVEAGFKLALSSLAQAVPGRVMRFGSTSSSPPVSPTPSERSLAGMSPDETSCNGDMFGEMVSSPLTQLTLHPSPQHPSNISPLSQPLSVVKEEIQSSCSLSRSSPASAQPAEPLPGVVMDTSSMDKDQMLQEKDKQIEELTRMLRQKQRLVETLRSQLEQGKMAGGTVVKKEGNEKSKTSPEVKFQTLIKASAIQPPTLPNGIVLKVKKELEPEEGMEGVTEEAEAKKPAQPMQCSQETLLRLQQIQRLQVQQTEQQKQQPQPKQQQQSQVQLRKATEAKLSPQKQQQQKKDAQILLHQQQQLQQLIIQQTQHKQLLAQQKLAQQKLAQQKLTQQKIVPQNQLKQTQGHIQAQQKNQVQLKQVQVQIQNQTGTNQKPAGSQMQQRKQLKAQQRQQQKQQTAAATTQQVTPVIINQQNGTPLHTQAFSLDLLKANGTPTLVTDSNGNHYLIALTSHTTDGQNGVTSLAKTNGRITLQRLQSTPSKLPSTDSQSKEQPEVGPASQLNKKGQKAGLHLDTDGAPQPSQSVTAPPNLQPFFDDMSDSESQSNLMSSLKQENGVNSQQMDDLFDILLKSGEIPGFKANPDPSLASPLRPTLPIYCPVPLHLSPPTPTEPLISPQPSVGEPCSGSGRLEDFLESTTGAPLLGMESDGGLTLIDDLHSQMLSTPSILDHPPSPMDTSDLGFSPHSAGLDFGDPTLDSMDWLDISMVGSASGGSENNGGGRVGGGGASEGDGGTSLAPLAPHTPPSVFSADFLDSTDLQLHWESCL
ncbi:LOW QUALITY PROTEIN: myocardin related transcription factor Ab [Acanthochromis polyacanthus]|uniref:LOW QUALITY PROTEIN: myocardin related transcription factor Ab n=1 Tax=Acanthochromis polyacanthus TaxID=80966 RepID=UPI0022348C19|nr:LOW QUALITY PROTEIN: myocardin related transcription factor Ab [Acanthochromis polyacanthus]